MSDSAPDSGGRSARPTASSLSGGERNPLDWARDIGEADRVIADLDRYLVRRRRRRLGAVASGAVVLFLGAVLWQPWRTGAPALGSRPPGPALVIRPETRALPDGSTVELNRGATLEVDFSDALRRVTLRGGDGHFAVTKDPARPFIVVADRVEVRAVGTAFVVAPSAGRVAVVVTEGRVAISRPGKISRTGSEAPRTSAAVEVGAGEGVRVSTALTAAPIAEGMSAAERSAMLAWRVPRLEFSDTPLVEVVMMFNAHGAVRLALADASLGALQISGVLRADDPESLLRLLDAEFGLKAAQREGTWHVRRR